MKAFLAEACQNTFLLFDFLDHSEPSPLFFTKARRLLDVLQRDDALILTPSKAQGDTLYVNLIVFGLDGKIGEFCGNGARASAAYLYAHYPKYSNFFFVTKHGNHAAMNQDDGSFSIELPAPNGHLNKQFIKDPEILNKFSANYVEVLEPHLVFFKKMEDQELYILGRKLNGLTGVFPHGINVNASYTQDGHLFVKTYERGVQRLTKSCGTGSVASAFCHWKKEQKGKVTTPGGALEVELSEEMAILTGPASFNPNYSWIYA